MKKMTRKAQMTEAQKIYFLAFRAHRGLETALRDNSQFMADMWMAYIREYQTVNPKAEAAAYEAWKSRDLFGWWS